MIGKVNKFKAVQIIPISQIDLDSNNIRHGIALENPGEEEIIAYLIREEKVYELAKHIVKNGINPLESNGVLRKGKNYIMLEGNRRLCALKLLNNPTLAGGQRKKYANLIHKASVPNSLRCHVFNTRLESRKWLELKHTSGQPASVRPWGPIEKLLLAQRDKNRLAGQLLKYAIEKGLFSEKNIRKISITTLTRYLSTPAVRQTMGIVSSSELIIDNEVKFKKYVRAFLDDALSKKLSSRTSAKNREEYATSLKQQVSPSSRRLKVPPPKPAKKAEPRTKKIIDSNWAGFALLEKHAETAGLQRIHRIVTELRDINSKTFVFATACLLRMLMECVARRYLNYSPENQPTQKNLYKEVAKQLHKTTDVPESFTEPLRQAQHKHHFLSPDTQSGWVHGRLTPEQKDLEIIWENFNPIITKILDLIVNSDKS